MSTGIGDVDPFRSAVASASAEVPSDSDAASSDVQDPFRSAQADPQEASAPAPSDSGAASGDADPFKAPGS